MKDHNCSNHGWWCWKSIWPASKQCCPKQFQDVLGSGKTLIQNTFDRLKSFIPAENILVLTNTIYKEIVMEQLPEISGSQVVLEPIMRNTPAILLAAMKIHNRDPRPGCWWLQVITDPERKFV